MNQPARSIPPSARTAQPARVYEPGGDVQAQLTRLETAFGGSVHLSPIPSIPRDRMIRIRRETRTQAAMRVMHDATSFLNILPFGRPIALGLAMIVAACQLAPASLTSTPEPVVEGEAPQTTMTGSPVTASDTWHGADTTLLQQRGILSAMNAITDPGLRRMVGDYAQTQYFKDGLEQGMTNRMWMVTVAAGVQDVWNDPAKRADLQSVGFVSAADCYETLVRTITVESDAGTRLGNPDYSRVYGLAHAEDITWLTAASRYATADDVGQTPEDWEHTKQTLASHGFARAARTEAGQTVIKARSYGRAFAHIALPLFAEALHQTMRDANLSGTYFQRNRDHRYLVWGLGSPQATTLLRMNPNTRVADINARWRGIAADNRSLYRHADGRAKTRAEVVNTYTERVRETGPNRFFCRTNAGFNLNETRPNTGWCRMAGFKI